MASIFWTGKLSLYMKFLVNANNLLALISGKAADTAAMKQHIKDGYEGACSDHVTHYDEFGRDITRRSPQNYWKELTVGARKC